MEIISKQDAKNLGSKRYFTGNPCIKGHVAERMISNDACFSCAAERDKKYKQEHRETLRLRSMEANRNNKEYHRDYYLKNKEKYKARSDKRYAENRDSILAAQRIRIKLNPAVRSDAARKYRAKNGEKISALMRANYMKNKDVILAKGKKRHQEDPSKAAAKVALRRSRKLLAVPSWFSEFDEFVWAEAQHLVQKRCEETGRAWHADHMIPLTCRSATGLHVWNNCQVIPGVLNLQKHNKMVLAEPFEWISLLN